MANIKGNLRGRYKSKHLYYGYGNDDTDYVTKCSYPVEGFIKSGKSWVCPYHRKWSNMLRRAYSEEYHRGRKTYKDVTVCEEWLLFSNFKKWVDTQPERDWKELQLDKDFLSSDCKVYSPSTCIFISTSVNNFIIDSGAVRGECMLGVYIKNDGRRGKYQAACNDPFKRRCRYIGGFVTEIEAHFAWKSTKHKYALELAELQNDPRIADILRTKYK